MERSGHRSLLQQQCTDICRDGGGGALSLHRARDPRKKTRGGKKREERSEKRSESAKENRVSSLCVDLNHEKLSSHPLLLERRPDYAKITCFLRRIALRNRDTSQRQASQTSPSKRGAMNALFRGATYLSFL